MNGFNIQEGEFIIFSIYNVIYKMFQRGQIFSSFKMPQVRPALQLFVLLFQICATLLAWFLWLLNLIWGLLTVFGSPRLLLASMLRPREYGEFTMNLFESIHAALLILIPNRSQPELIESNYVPQRPQTPEQKKTRWFFLNGVCTDGDSGGLNINRLQTVFDVPVTYIHNPSNSIWLDLFECVMEKLFNVRFDISAFALYHILPVLNDANVDKVILITHSQGTIIGAHLLQDLKHICPQLLKKLELYQFANCASYMRYQQVDGVNQPYMESIGNLHDPVASLGMFSMPAFHYVIQGPKYVNREKRGHLLDVSYLDRWGFEEQYTLMIEPGVELPPGTRQTSKLYDYVRR